MVTAESCVHRVLSHSPSSLHINQTQHCKRLPGLVSSQAQLCSSHLELMQTIIQAAREVKKTCQKTFGDMRWNCSSIEIAADAPKYRPDLDRGATPKVIRRRFHGNVVLSFPPPETGWNQLLLVLGLGRLLYPKVLPVFC